MQETDLKNFQAAKELNQELRKVMRGEVRFDSGSRALYATDASNYRQVPIGVVIPKDSQDAEAAMACCRKFQAPVLARGGGTSLAGQCCNVAVVFDMSKYMNRVLAVDPERKTADVEPGTILDDLQKKTRPHGYVFGPDPSTHSRCTLGGMIGNNSCGVHSVATGRTVDNIEELEVLTYRGQKLRLTQPSAKDLQSILQAQSFQGDLYRQLMQLKNKYAEQIRLKFPKIPRRVSGFAIDQLLEENQFNVARSVVGSEGTCIMVLSAKVRLVPDPKCRVLLVAGYSNVFEAADAIPEWLEQKPEGLEGMDRLLIEYMKLKQMKSEALEYLPEGDGWLMVEFGGETTGEAKQKALAALKNVDGRRHDRWWSILDKKEEQDLIWEIRESGLGATSFVPGHPDTWPGWEDSAVEPESMGSYLRRLRKLMDDYDYKGSFYGHFGDGCLHTRISFDLSNKQGAKKYRSFIGKAADLVVEYGGSFSGEHGDGQARGEILEKMFGPELMQAFRDFKKIWDPDSKMNPGKVINPYGIEEDLRLQSPLKMQSPQTNLQFYEDNYDFARSATRCVGVGKCRRLDGGTMCPSFMVTREEMHSTRGRARLLFEMLQGGVIKNEWKEEAVKESLDLCLACKGCKSDCPVNVDMATYKAEFLSHYYKNRFRPRHAYALGLIYWWAKFSSFVPSIVNAFTQNRFFGKIAKMAAGIHPDRTIPEFAQQSFRRWYGQQKDHGPEDGITVILWPDTFNNFFYPGVLISAANVLKKLGFKVTIPESNFCCGRPLYDFGMLTPAKNLLKDIMRGLMRHIELETPVVVLEPSCAAVFRDELLRWFPEDDRAKKLSRQVVTLEELLNHYAEKMKEIPDIGAKAIVQGHCHQKAVLGMADDKNILECLGMDYEILDSGCCGMAGSFGFEKEHYVISVKAGERVLLPRVREEPEDSFILANGFSCREQIRQLAGREPLHLVQLLDIALNRKEISSGSKEVNYERHR